MAKTENSEVEKYNESYQDVLWIDDMDTQQASNRYDRKDKYRKEKYKIDNIKSWFPTQYSKIDLVMQMKDAFEKIVNNCNKYNLVIFDMDMRDGFKAPNGNINIISEKFSDYNIICTDKKDNNGTEIMQKIAGAYLYLLLLTKGYPANRMIIYTGNFTVDSSLQDQSEKENLKTCLQQYCPSLNFDKQSLQKEQETELDLEQYYDKEKNSYYRIRRLVLQACDYWKKDIDNKKDEDIPFNKIYFSKDTDKQISTENFKELLERVEMMFPVIQPASPEKVYYQAARILCEYHEESTKIQDIDQYIYPFHAVCRNFRNWSSHNKFHKAEMPADIFALLFCITLRTYFDFLVYYDKGKKEKISGFEKGYFAYEDVYNFKQSNNQNDDMDLFSIIKGKLIKESSLPLVLNRKTWKESIPYSELVWLWGEDKNNRAHIHYIFFPLVMKDCSMKFQVKPNDMKLNALSGEENLFAEDSPSNYCTYTDTRFMESAYKESCRICYENKDKKENNNE